MNLQVLKQEMSTDNHEPYWDQNEVFGRPSKTIKFIKLQ